MALSFCSGFCDSFVLASIVLLFQNKFGGHYQASLADPDQALGGEQSKRRGPKMSSLA